MLMILRKLDEMILASEDRMDKARAALDELAEAFRTSVTRIESSQIRIWRADKLISAIAMAWQGATRENNQSLMCLGKRITRVSEPSQTPPPCRSWGDKNGR
jgi:hypothetical protein